MEVIEGGSSYVKPSESVAVSVSVLVTKTLTLPSPPGLLKVEAGTVAFSFVLET